MLEALTQFDLRWIHAINGGWASVGLDSFFCFITNEKNYFLPGGLLLAGLLWKGGTRGRFLVAALLLNLLLTDQLSSHVIKTVVQRPRPCQALTEVRTPCGCGPASSFPSSHAANSAGLATLIALAYPAWAVPAVAFALLVALSRVYVGVHYPTDVMCGALLGLACGLLVWRVKGWAQGTWEARRSRAPARKSARRRRTRGSKRA